MAENAEKDDTNEGGQYIFHAQRGLFRTPPPVRRNSYGETGIQAPNQETSTDTNRKRPRKATPEEKGSTQHVEHQIAEPNQAMVNIQYWTNQIKVAISKEVNSKISFTRQDQVKVRDSLDNMMEESTKLIYKLEQEKTTSRIMEEKIETLEEAVDMQKVHNSELKKEYREMKTILKMQKECMEEIMEEVRSIRKDQKEQRLDVSQIKTTILEEMEKAQAMEEEPSQDVRSQRPEQESNNEEDVRTSGKTDKRGK